ncbi:MAG TPA: prepilin-type N-terminal cleavage/methylation domain-containing protein [Planctomycetota bacterium]|nr:prepilin-type N-terminal cleavage/methylation domain-containing protein [Planctomycetota bacterium]
MRKCGLTLLELLVVVAVMVALAAIVVPLLGSSQNDASMAATRTTMLALRDAIFGTDRASGFVEDVGDYPAKAHLAGWPGGWPEKIHDLLSNEHLPAPKQTFDIHTHRGWNGPYLRSADGVYTVDTAHGFTSDYCYNSGADLAIIDAWNHPIVIQYITATVNPGDATVRLVSAGPDGVLNTLPSDASAAGDDIVVPLKRAGL